jgi:hypothetical protein
LQVANGRISRGRENRRKEKGIWEINILRSDTMAKKRKHKTKTNAAGYVEKISSQIFNKYHKEITKMIKGYIKSSKKMLPGLKKRLKNKIKEELKTSFRLIPSKKVRKV